MRKSGFGFDKIMGRRKSSGNAIDEPIAVSPSHPAPPESNSSGGGFRVMSQVEVERAKAEAVQRRHAEKSRFGRFSGLGGAGHKGRNQSFDDGSPDSSKRDSKSSSGTSMSRPYDNVSLTNRYGSTSTLPSSADTDPNDNLFSHMPARPYIAPHSSHTFSLSNTKKALPTLPKSKTMDPSTRAAMWDDLDSTNTGKSTSSSRTRAMTSSSYASTAVAPKLDADLNFDTNFDDLFSGMDEKQRSSPEIVEPVHSPTGRSLLSERRTFQAKPIDTKPNPNIEAPPTSWDSRGSGDRLISSPTEDETPPPVPPHTYGRLSSNDAADPSPSSLEDEDAKLVRNSLVARKSFARPSSPEQNPASTSSTGASGSAASLQTPLSSRSASNDTTPKAPAPIRSNSENTDEDDDNLFAPSKTERKPLKKPSIQILEENVPLTTAAAVPRGPGRRVMTAAEFRMQKKYQKPEPEEESEEDDYEDEEEAIAKREQEELQRRKQQQLRMGREIYRRSAGTTNGTNRASTAGDVPPTGFPLEMSLENDGWEDEDVPLAVLKEHGFPTQSKPPTRPADANPSYTRNSFLPGALPDRPASTGAMSNPNARASTYRPPFAKGLPVDPFLGAGLVQQSNRESLGFSSGAASVHGGEAYNANPGVPPGGLVGIIQMEEHQKKMRRGGGASSNQGTGQSGGPFTYGGAMNGMGATPNPMNRMSQMPGAMGPMNGMNGMGQMDPMMMQQAMMNPMMAMGMNPMMMQEYWQQMMAMQMQQMNQMGMGGMNMGQPGMMPNTQMNRMSQMPQMNGMNGTNGFGASSVDTQSQAGFLSPNTNFQRPMSIASSRAPQQQPDVNSLNRPFSQFSLQMPQFSQPMNSGYTPSIAPSERSNVGLSSRYRPVNTNPQDSGSTISSQTLQATGGAPPTPGSNGTIKGILKKNTPSPTPPEPPAPREQQPDEENWASLAARRKKFGKKEKKEDDNTLKELYTSLDGV